MNVFVANPEWRWWIIGYFFLGGIAAGCYFIAALLELVGAPEDKPLARLGYKIAFPLVVLCGLFLTLDLNRPERFWHMLLQSEVVHDALDKGWPWSAAGWGLMVQAPMLKHWSPMSIGAWALFLFGAFSFVSCWASVWPAGRIARLLNRRWLGWPWRVAGSGVGFFVASYTGVLLTATNQPLWSQTDWLGALFLTSATSTALATLALLGRRREATDATVQRLERAQWWALLLELVVFIIFLVSLGPLLPVLPGRNVEMFLLGPLGIGILWPLGHHLVASARYAWSRGLAVLVGGLSLRYAVIMVAPVLLQRHAPDVAQNVPVETPSAWHSISPEDGRRRDGSPGASELNRPQTLVPRSKVIDEAP